MSPNDQAEGGRHALLVVDHRSVRLDEDTEVTAVKVADDTPDGAIYVPLRPLCVALGLNVPGQIQRIRRRKAYAEMLRTLPVPTAGGRQDLICLDIEALPGWLAGIDTSRVRSELEERLVGYQQWARRRIADAFFAELAGGRGDARAVGPTAGNGSALDQIEAFGLALTAFARQQREFELRYVTDHAEVRGELTHLGGEIARLDGRLDRAAEAFATLVRDVTIRLDGSDVITDAQQADIKAMVQAIGREMQRRGLANPYQSIWTSLYKQFRVPTYSRIKIAQYPAVMAWLEEQQRAPADAPVAEDSQGV